MTVLRCTGCGGAVVASRYEDGGPTNDGVAPKTKFYNCPLCGLGMQHAPGESPDDFVAVARPAALVSQKLDGET